MKKVLFITPHLSTGGMPQVLLKRIQQMDFVNIGIIEWTNIDSDVYDVQKSQIKKLVQYYRTLPHIDNGKKEICLDYIKEFKPDLIHFEEFPEHDTWYSYGDSYESTTNTLKQIHNFDIPIVNTSHTSLFELENKIYPCTKYYLVSKYHEVQYKNLLYGKDYSVIEHPYEVKTITDTEKNESLNNLNFDRRKKHILIVGLFTPGKNQGYIFYLAELLGSDYHFHFIGNQAGNFEDYWKPLMDNKPKNVFCYDEVKNVDEFYIASDLIIHPSLHELNPTIFYEALSVGRQIIAFPLETYKYSSYHKYLNFFQFDNLDESLVDAFNYEMKTSPLVYNLKLIESLVGKNIKVESTIELFKNKVKKFYSKLL